MPVYPKGLWPEYDVWDQALEDWWWADRFGWTPDEVGELPPETYSRLRHIDNAAAQIRKAQQERR